MSNGSLVMIINLLLFSCVRDYCVGRYKVAGRLAKDSGAVRFALQEAHQGHG